MRGKKLDMKNKQVGNGAYFKGRDGELTNEE